MIYTMVKDGRLVAPVKFGFRSIGWVASDIDDFIEQRIFAMDQGKIWEGVIMIFLQKITGGDLDSTGVAKQNRAYRVLVTS